jgi:hypothetical protein
LPKIRKAADPAPPHWLVLRQEAEWYNAYWTTTHSLMRAELLGSIQQKIIDRSKWHKMTFDALMQKIAHELEEVDLKNSIGRS